MLDFLKIVSRTKNGILEVYPKFIVKKSEDLLIRGGDFYAIWLEDRGCWSTDEDDAVQLIDHEIDKKVEEFKAGGIGATGLYLWDSDSQMIDKFHKYCQKQRRDNDVQLDEKLIFSNTETNKKDYASKKLPYPLEKGNVESWDRLMSVLYSPAEREKLEWAIGSIVCGDSKLLQKFVVLYGSAGTGKSTVLNIIQKLFAGYYAVFDAKALGSNSSSFALEPFAANPLVAIQHDGDLSRIEDNTRLNSLVSHEEMTVNVKFRPSYPMRFNAFLFLGTNKPVKITDAKSGLLRRLIDVSPTGEKLSPTEYKSVMKRIDFELGAIAYHCQEVYLNDPGKYDDYTPESMLESTNDFYNFILDSAHVFAREDGTTLTAAWQMYQAYCEESKMPYPYSKRIFKDELKNYFREYHDRHTLDDGTRIRSYYVGFKTYDFDEEPVKEVEIKPKLIEFKEQPSILDTTYASCPAQYATSKGTPTYAWDNVKTKLSDIDTSKLHYLLIPEELHHVFIDFDLKDENGDKCFEKNLEAASKWPPTYAELSKSGGGIHLHYIYSGDPTELSSVYDANIEVKVCKGKSPLRRRLTKCNNLPIATISSGLPLKEVNKVVDFEGIKNERMLRTMIKRNLNKEYHGYTKPSIDYIDYLLNQAYEKKIPYDVSDMYDAIFEFAVQSSNNSDYCLKVLDKMKLKSEDEHPVFDGIDGDPLVFYDVEVFPNLFLVNWKVQGKGKPVIRMINPKPSEIEALLKFKLVGFNNRDYDNHMLYGCLIGYDNAALYDLSTRLVSNNPEVSSAAKFGKAYNLSYTDVYDFAATKQSLKKWEIELGIHHLELGLPWDKPVPKELWPKVAEYCDNDVIATEAVFDHLAGDWGARQMLVSIIKTMHPGINVSYNDKTNTLSGKIIFGTNRNPQSEFNWRDMSKPVGSNQYEEYRQKFGSDYIFRVFDADGLPLYRDYVPYEELPKGYSILPFFPGYKFENGVSTYLDEILGEGGKVFGEPGIYYDVWDGDVTSMHPHSAIYECLFGPRYTKVFKELVAARVAIKGYNFDLAASLLGGALEPYLKEELVDDLAYALKIVINSIYGLTAARFMNIFRSANNKDNIVAKRGCLFMTLLKREVTKLGYKVAHIKTDSIKIPNADQIIQDFICRFGKEYGYNFETEAEFDKFCLVNDAVYIARHKTGKKAGKWDATGKQFAVPYVFKTLFSKEDIEFDDLCETFAVKQGELYLDLNEGLNEEEHDLKYVGRVGRFCPIEDGHGGGILRRVTKDEDGTEKYFAPPGTLKDTKAKIPYRWLEAEMVYSLGDKRKHIDMSYYRKLVDDAKAAIEEYGDFDQFISDEPIDPLVEKVVLPWEYEADMVF